MGKAIIGTENPDYSEMYLCSRGFAPPLWHPGWDRDYPPYSEFNEPSPKPCPKKPAKDTINSPVPETPSLPE